MLSEKTPGCRLHFPAGNKPKSQAKKRAFCQFLTKCPYIFSVKRLNYAYIDCRWAFFTLLDFEGNPVAFIQRFKAAGIDSGKMNEHIRTIFLLDKPVAFAAVKPFDYSIRHGDILLS